MKTDVTFPSSGMNLAGHLYAPAGHSEGDRLPAIVIGHPTTGVKEQAPASYAPGLAAAGYLVLTFDAAHQGASEGEPRGLEDPFQRAEDFRNAVTYLTTRPDVDPGRIGVLGICGSGGYAPYAAQTDHRMKAVATVSAADVPTFLRSADPEGFKQLVEESGRARTEQALGGPVRMVPVLPDAVDDSTPASVREFFDYYKTPRAQHPRSVGAYALHSADLLDQFDSYAEVHKIAPRPLLMIAGSRAETLPFSSGAVEKAGDSAELFLVDGATHVDLYDREEAVTPAVAKLSDFFGKHL